jgi:hypothetical protein
MSEAGTGCLKRDELPDPGRCAEAIADLVALNGAGIELQIYGTVKTDAE